MIKLKSTLYLRIGVGEGSIAMNTLFNEIFRLTELVMKGRKGANHSHENNRRSIPDQL